MADEFEGDQIQGPAEAVIPQADYHAGAPATVTLDTDGFTGLRVGVDLQTLTGGSSPTVTVTIKGVDPCRGTTYTLLASTALASAGVLTQLIVDPRIAASANAIAQLPLPARVQIVVTLGGTQGSNTTFGVSATLHR
jgi:hypothetical protein